MRLLNEEQKKWVEVIGEFAKKEIEPIMLDWDKVVDPSKAIPFEAYEKAFKLGLNSFEIPKEYGGNKVTLDVAEVMYEEMGYYDGNFASVMQTTNLALKPILIGGTPEQVQYFAKHILEGKGYGAFKPVVGDAVIEHLRPIREESQRLLKDKAYLEGVYRDGAMKASYVAEKTLRKVYKKVGFVAK